jgi:hypothetical protein
MLSGVFASASLRAENTPTPLPFAGGYGLAAVRAQADYLDAAYQCVLNHISPRYVFSSRAVLRAIFKLSCGKRPQNKDSVLFRPKKAAI